MFPSQAGNSRCIEVITLALLVEHNVLESWRDPALDEEESALHALMRPRLAGYVVVVQNNVTSACKQLHR